MGSFNGVDLFGSGPARFRQLVQGDVMLSNHTLGTSPPNGSSSIGMIELDVVVKGRLVAATEGDLWMLRDAVTAQLTDPPVQGSLFDDKGRKWESMSFIKFTEADRTDLGRVASIGYEAVFRKFA